MNSHHVGSFLCRSESAFGKPVCRLGLASHGGAELTGKDVLHALDSGVNFLNWAGDEDAISRTIAALGARRDKVIVCVQFAARNAKNAAKELNSLLETLGTDYVDVVTLYYVESRDEWREVIAPEGALEFCREAQRQGRIRRLGVTTHQRVLAADMAQSRLLDVLMIRYNAAHRGAEREVFPVTDVLGMPIIAYTALRWGGLLRGTPDDPPGFILPTASAWYRFVLQSPSVSVVLSAPHNRAELNEALKVLQSTAPMDEREFESLAEHGQRVRKHAGHFP
jgi:predicted aldo/keto reductase-like oxidoreductase